MARLLVTGGAGFIGSNFVHYWLRNSPGDRVVVLDLLTYAGNVANLGSLSISPMFAFVCGDIREQTLVEDLLEQESIDTIVHFAAESHVDRSIAEPTAFVETNVNGTHALLRAARKVWLERSKGKPQHRFHHVSTDEVYGTLGPDDPPFTEVTPYAPNSPYAASKAASDFLVRAYHRTYGLQTTISNCSNNYGPYQFPEKLIPLTITNALLGKPLPVYGDGSNIRDWLHVEDHCRGIECVLRRGRIGETYNIGGAEERANLDLVETVCRLIDQQFAENPHLAALFPDAPASSHHATRSLVRFVEDRPGHDFRYAIDSTRIREEIGFEPHRPLRAGLAETVHWYIAHASWWRDILNGNYRLLRGLPSADPGTTGRREEPARSVDRE